MKISDRKKRILELLKKNGSVTVVAGKLRVTRQTVYNYIRLSELSQIVQDAVDRREMSLYAALRLHGRPKNLQEEVLARLTTKSYVKGRHRGMIMQREVDELL